MTSQVFYRKWRPQTLAEVVGQEPITQTLLHALETGRVAHAYLFCGPRGTGKTSTGRILAKAVNCTTNGKGEPCNSCEMCQATAQGRALDVIEIDAASNRGIDEIRELREKVNFAPNVAKSKVYIIDEVHMLTEPASNALLKTLEECPPYVIFILATTEPHKMLPTVLSRCQRFDFRRLSQTAIASKLGYICEKEGIEAESQALKLISRSASGSLRDAENLLEQLVTYYSYHIDTSQVEDMLGITTDYRVSELAEHIAHKDIARGLKTINSVASDGLDLGQFNRALIEYLRGMLLVKSGGEEALDITPEDLAQIKELVQGLLLEEILTAIKLFAQIDFRSSSSSPLPLELALVESLLPQEREEAILVKSGASHFEAEHLAQGSEPPHLEPDSPFEYLSTQWSEFVDSLRGMGSGGNLDAFLRSACEPVAIEGDTLVLGFYHPFHKDRIENPKYRHLVENKLAERFGTPSKVHCILKLRAKPPAAEDHLVKAVLEMGGRIIDTTKNSGEAR